jgi:phosphopantothenoylcysteine decarboxylase/phosphopantothenate--cysteine ligase
MADAAWKAAEDADIAFMAAAVADFTPENPASAKLRRADGPPEITLVASPNVLGGIAAMADRPFLVGFAAETGSFDSAVEKAKNYGVDLLVGNDVTAIGSEFGGDTNEVVLILPDGTTEPWQLMTKDEVADRLIDRTIELSQGAPS